MTLEGAAGGSSAFNQACSRQLLEGFLGTVPFCLALLDLQFRFVWVGPGLGSALGFEAEDSLGRSMREVAPVLANSLEPLIGELLATGPSGGARDFAVGNYPDGEPDCARRAELRIVTSAGGEVIGFAIVASPVAGALREATPHLADREAAWCMFVESFAHDLRNPLTPILAAAQLLRRCGVEKPGIVEWAAVAIERQVRQLNTRLDDVLTLARAKRGALVIAADDLDLAAMLEQVIAEFQSLAQEGGLVIEAQVPACGLPVRGEKARLERILRILLTRAIETTPSGASVKIQAVRATDHIQVRFHDSGTGFETAMSESVFDPFDRQDPSSQLKRSHNDRVGLALARALVMQMRGSLAASSAGIGRGAEFVLRLPITDKSLLPHAPQDPLRGDGS